MHRSACLLLTLLAAPQIAGAYPTPPPGTHAVRQAPAKGLFLVADAGMPDPRFRETVILLVEHDAGGTLGLIVNRATGVSLAQALPELEGDGAAEHILFLGGPVGLDRLALLARGTPPPASSEHVVGDIHLSRSREALAALVEQRSASALRVFAGYAGWAPGQLEAELLQGSWFLTPADAERVFARDPAGVWRELYDRRRRGTVVQRLAPPFPRPNGRLAGIGAQRLQSGFRRDTPFMTRDATTAKESTEHDSAVAQAIRSRRTINFFKPGTPPRELIVDAVDAARWAPNHHLTEPWHFYLLGADTVARVVELNTELVRAARGDKAAEIKRKRWQTIPGWMVVTCERGDDELRQREDYAACCCAVYSLSLCLWSRGVGVKWTTGDVTRDPRFYDAVWVDPALETVVALLWYGYPAEVPVSVRKPVEQILIDV